MHTQMRLLVSGARQAHRCCTIPSVATCVRHFSAPHVVSAEPLTSSSRPAAAPWKKSWSHEQKVRFHGAQRRERDAERERERAFPRQRGDHDLERGIDGEAKRVVAEAEREYRVAELAYSRPAGGFIEASEPYVEIDPSTGAEVRVRRLAVPFGETMVTSDKERFALRGHVGQLDVQHKSRLDASASIPSASVKNVLLQREQDIRSICESQRDLSEKAELCGSILTELLLLGSGEEVKSSTEFLPLHRRTWEQMFHVWSLAHSQPLAETYLASQEAARHRLLPSSSAPLPANAAGEGKLQTVELQQQRYFEFMKRSYFHMRATFTAPSSQILEHFMVAIALQGADDKATLHLATRLLLDCDKFVTLPTRTTLAAYFDVCNRCQAMDLAVNRFADAIDRLQLEPDTGMATSLIRGLNQNGLVEEAVSMLARLQHVEMDVTLLNATMETLLLSQDPQAVFAAYSGVALDRSSNVQPSSETFVLLLLACERLGDWSRTKQILSDVQRLGIRGSASLLNLLLKGLAHEKMSSYAEQLYLTMRLKGVDVWPSLENVMPKRSRVAAEMALKTLSKRQRKQLVKRGARGGPLQLSKHVVRFAQRHSSMSAGLTLASDSEPSTVASNDKQEDEQQAAQRIRVSLDDE